nr:phospholipase DDHD1-like [Lepeophtheirus salmonis]
MDYLENSITLRSGEEGTICHYSKSDRKWHCPAGCSKTLSTPASGTKKVLGTVTCPGRHSELVQRKILDAQNNHLFVVVVASQLYGEDLLVRWFYKREVEKDWRPFMGYDSLRIELRYRHIWQTKWSDVDRRTNTLREEYHNSHRASVRTMINNAHQQRRARSLSRVHYDRATGPHTAMLMNGYVDDSSQSSPMSHPSQSLHHGGPPMHHQHIPRTHPAAQEDYYDSGEYETASGGVGGGSANQSGIRPSTAGNNYNPYSQRGPHYSTRGRQKSYRHYRSSDNFINDDREMRIVVRGGVYEVDLVEWKCHSIYWPGEAFDILRGTWFHETTWQPVQCEHADRIEREHLSRFLNHKMADYVWDPTTSSRLEKQVHHTINFPEFHVDWLSPEEVYLHRENASSQIYRGISASLGFKKPTGTRLFRGYRELSSHSDKLADISHIVFVIHGVGQVVDDTTILRNTNILRDNVHAMIEKHFKSYQNETGQRIEFFPVEWRSSLTLDEGIVNIITPQRIMGLRNLLNSSAMDIMYYTSPLYRMEIWSALQEELNRIYEMFVQRNPYFEANGGKVSITAHSLGCVVTYDILTGWTQDVEHSWYSLQAHSMSHHPANHGRGRGRPAPMNEHRQTPMNAAQSGLLFRIENFFCLGSPLSVFLTLRWRDPQNTEYHDYILPRSLCKYLYNIYHPCDPVAYRVEPIFMKFYAQIEPVHLYSENDPNKSPYDKIPLQPLQGARKENVEGYSSDFTDSMLPLNIANGSINISVGKMAAGIGLQAASSGVSGALNGSSVGQAAGG